MKINNLTKVYKTEYELVKALNDMTLEFPQKGLIFIVGVSGSGKSSLVNDTLYKAVYKNINKAARMKPGAFKEILGLETAILSIRVAI